MSNLELRPEVAAFAQLMEKKLRENDHKPGWKDAAPSLLLDRISEELLELSDEVKDTTRWRSVTSIAREAADVANIAMMVADVCGGLPAIPPAPKDGEEPERWCLAHGALESDHKPWQAPHCRWASSPKCDPIPPEHEEKDAGPCLGCDGKGATGGGTLTLSDGQSKVYGLAMCAACHGSGRATKYIHIKKCDCCSGVGLIVAEYLEPQKCPACEGTGLWNAETSIESDQDAGGKSA